MKQFKIKDNPEFGDVLHCTYTVDSCWSDEADETPKSGELRYLGDPNYVGRNAWYLFTNDSLLDGTVPQMWSNVDLRGAGFTNSWWLGDEESWDRLATLCIGDRHIPAPTTPVSLDDMMLIL
jgi:hypothetical protein